MSSSLRVWLALALLAKGKGEIAVLFLVARTTGFDYRDALERAQAHAGLKDEAVALLLGVSRQRYAQLRDSGGMFGLDRLARLAADRDGFVMVEQFLMEWSTCHGISSLDAAVQMVKDQIQLVTRLQMATQKVRMAKATLAHTKQIRRTA